MDNPYLSPSAEDQDNEDATINRGRNVVISVIVFGISFSLLTILMFNVTMGSQRLPAQVVRFVITIGLLVCLYRGQSWARYVIGGLYGAAALLSLFGLPKMLSVAHPLNLGHYFVMIAGFGASAVALFTVPSVRSFMKYQRSRFK